MTYGGWISMTITLTFVLGLFFWCCYKMITAPETVEELIDLEDRDVVDEIAQDAQR